MSTLDFETDRDLLAVENKRQPSIQKNEWSAAEIRNFRASFSEEDWVDFLIKLNTKSSPWYRPIETMVLNLNLEKIDAILGNLEKEERVKLIDSSLKDSLRIILQMMDLVQFKNFILQMSPDELTSLTGRSSFYTELESKLVDEKMTALVKEIKKGFGLDLEENAKNRENLTKYLAQLKNSTVFKPILFYGRRDERKVEMAMAATQYGWVGTIAEIRNGIPTDMWLKFLEDQRGYRMCPDCLEAAAITLRADLMRVLKSGVTEEFFPQWSHLIGNNFYMARFPVKEEQESAEIIDLIMEGVTEEDWARTMDADTLAEIIEEQNLSLLKKIKSKFSKREKIDGQEKPISASWSKLMRTSTLRAALISGWQSSNEEESIDKRTAVLEELVDGADSARTKDALLDQEHGSLFIKKGSTLEVRQLQIFKEKMSDDDWNTVMLSHNIGRNILFSVNHDEKIFKFILDNTKIDVLVQMLNTYSYGKNELPLFFYSKKEAKLVKNKIGKDNWLKVITFRPYGYEPSPIDDAIKKKKWQMLGFLILDLRGNEELLTSSSSIDGLDSGEEVGANPLKSSVIEALNQAVSVEGSNFFQLSAKQKNIIWKGYSVALDLWSKLKLPMNGIEDYKSIAKATFIRELSMSDAISDKTLLASYLRTGRELSKYNETETVDVGDVIDEIAIRLLVPLAILKIGRGVSDAKLVEIWSRSNEIAKNMMASSSELMKNSSLPLSASELLAFSKQWHFNHSAMPREIVDLIDWKEWKSVVENKDEGDVEENPIFEYKVDGQNVRVVVLTDSDLLAHESANLGHCVGRGGYDVKCAQGKAHILSIKVFDKVEKKWISSSTVELDKDLKIVQHRAERNSQPKKIEQQAVKLFIADIKSERLNKTKNPGETEKSLSWSNELSARLGSDAKFRSIGFVPSVEKVIAVMEHYAHLSWKVKKNKDGSVEMRSIFCPKIVSRKIGDTYLHRSNFFVDGSKGRVPMNRQSLVDAIIPILDYWVDILIKRVNKNDDLQLKSLSEIFAAKN